MVEVKVLLCDTPKCLQKDLTRSFSQLPSIPFYPLQHSTPSTSTRYKKLCVLTDTRGDPSRIISELMPLWGKNEHSVPIFTGDGDQSLKFLARSEV